MNKPGNIWKLFIRLFCVRLAPDR